MIKFTGVRNPTPSATRSTHEFDDKIKFTATGYGRQVDVEKNVEQKIIKDTNSAHTELPDYETHKFEVENISSRLANIVKKLTINQEKSLNMFYDMNLSTLNDLINKDTKEFENHKKSIVKSFKSAQIGGIFMHLGKMMKLYSQVQKHKKDKRKLEQYRKTSSAHLQIKKNNILLKIYSNNYDINDDITELLKNGISVSPSYKFYEENEYYSMNEMMDNTLKTEDFESIYNLKQRLQQENEPSNSEHDPDATVQNLLENEISTSPPPCAHRGQNLAKSNSPVVSEQLHSDDIDDIDDIDEALAYSFDDLDEALNQINQKAATPAIPDPYTTAENTTTTQTIPHGDNCHQPPETSSKS